MNDANHWFRQQCNSQSHQRAIEPRLWRASLSFPISCVHVASGALRPAVRLMVNPSILTRCS